MTQHEQVKILLAKYRDQSAVYSTRKEALARDRKALLTTLHELIEQASNIEGSGFDLNITGIEL